ncbi:hypothetical protein [Nocardia anaemiae]|uniref:hypothetical protein n=1 Tax=Nocardia anaemiae TaxID=263910 RepID=UPI0007A50FDF|nr:hypothetical protein [Nocardia anaemiae]
MNTPTAVDPDDSAYLHDCLTDPGVLDENDAIRAMSIHHICPPQCLVLGRALDALSTEYTSIATPHAQSNAAGPTQRSVTTPMRPERSNQLDHHLADQLQKLEKLRVHIEEAK